MKSLALLCSALCLTACATAPVNEARGLAASWTSLDAIAKVVDGLAKSGVLHGRNAAIAASDLNQGVVILQAATTAYKAGDAATAEGDIAQAAALISAVIAITQTLGN